MEELEVGKRVQGGIMGKERKENGERVVVGKKGKG